MDPATVAIALVAASGSVATLRKVIERRGARRELASALPFDADTRDGTFARVTGTVRVVDELVVAPLSGVECVVARSRVRIANTWRLPRRREQFAMVSFVVDRDGEPPVAIEGVHARLDVTPLPLAAPRGMSSPERSRREALLRRVRLPLTAMATARFEETVVRPGDRITIAGLVMLDPGAPPTGELGHRDAPPSRLRLAGNADHPLVIGEAQA